MRNNYADIARRTNNLPNYTFKNDKHDPTKRESVYPVENEFEQVEINNNIKNIHRISAAQIKLPSKENNLAQIAIAPREKDSSTNPIVNSYSNFGNNSQSINIYPMKKFSDNISNFPNSQNSSPLRVLAGTGITPTRPNSTHFMNNYTSMPLSNSTNKQTIKQYIFGQEKNPLNTLSTNRTTHSYDQLKVPIKKGLFSLPKSANTIYAHAKSSSQNNFDNPGLLKLIPSTNIVGNVNSNAGINMNDQSSISIAREFSMEKYQINKSSLNLKNLTNRSINNGDENDSLVNSTLKKNDSTSSIYLNKYKVGQGISNITSITSIPIEHHSNMNLLNSLQADVSNLNNPEKYQVKSPARGPEMKLTTELNYKENQIPVTHIRENKPSAENKLNDKYQTFSGNNNEVNLNITGTNTPNTTINNGKSIEANMKEFITQPIKLKNAAMNSILKNKQLYEKESRRMVLEMIKIKARRKGQNVNKIVKDMRIDDTILCLEGNYQINTKMDNIYNQVTGSLEIKNNNFEINNNYFGSVTPPSGSISKVDSTKVLKPIPQFIYTMDEESSDKINLICYLVTPRILHMNIGSINSNGNQKIPFIFNLTPSSLCHEYGLEHYVFQWSELNSISPVGSIDILKIASCSKNSAQENIFVIETSKEKSLSTGHTALNLLSENNRYEIITNSPEDCKLYVNSLNYLSQLVKCKAYSFKGNSKIKS